MFLRRSIMAAAMLGALAVGGCSSIPGMPGGTTTPVDAQALIKQIQGYAVSACSFLPTASTVASIIGTLAGVGPQVSTASDVAAQICAAVTAAPTVGRKRGASAAPTVRGVVIHGRFIQ